MRQKARELAQHVDPPGYGRRRVTQQGVIVYAMDGPCRLPSDNPHAFHASLCGLHMTCLLLNVHKTPSWAVSRKAGMAWYSSRPRVSFETSFDSKQPKLEPKLVLALSETKCSFRLFRFYTETQSFCVSLNWNKQKTNRNSLIESIYCIGIFSYNFMLFRVVSVCFGLFRNSLFRLFRFLYRNNEFRCFNWTKKNRRPTKTVW